MNSNRLGIGAVFALFSLTASACRTPPPDVDGSTPGVDAAPDSVTPPSDGASGNDATTQGDGSTSGGLTIEQVRNPMAAGHPAPMSTISFNPNGLVATSSRLLSSGRTGGGSHNCRFTVWIGDGTSGPYTGVAIQEVIPLGTAADCFALPAGKIPLTIRPGQTITAITGATFSPFCSIAMGGDRATCPNFTETEVILGASATFSVGGMGAAPVANNSTVEMLGQIGATDVAPGALQYESSLVKVSNVIVNSSTDDAGRSNYTIRDAATGAMRSLVLNPSNSRGATCARTYLNSHSGMTLPSVTGILVPAFGQWEIQLLADTDIEGLTPCAGADGGMSDASVD